jgi:hypothetical protein
MTIVQTSCIGARFEDLTHIYRVEHPPQTEGKVIIYPPGRFVRQAVAQADISLPKEPQNKNWYAVMIMLTMYPQARTSDVAYVQVGIMRWQQNNFAPTAYVGIHRLHGRATFHYVRDMPLVGDGGHASVRLKNDRISITFNGRELASVPRQEVFPKGTVPYFQIAAQVYEPGDRVAGVIRNLLVQSDSHDSLTAVTSPCMYVDPELHMTRSGNDYTAEGVFKGGAGFSMFVETFGSCSQRNDN